MLQLTSLGDEGSALFGIDEQVLTKVVEHIVGYEIDSYEVRFTHTLEKRFQGQRADKSIPTIHFTSPSGMPEAITLFIKRHHQYEQNEAIHHKHLSLTDAPVPTLYGYYSEPRKRDITISEYLTPLLIDEPYDGFRQDAQTFRAFLKATALFTSIQITPQYQESLECGYLEQRFRSYASDLEQINSVTRVYTGGELLSQIAIASLKRTLHELCDEMDLMEKGVYHWDHRPCNAGWSTLQKQFVIFDLEDTMMAPRFLDIALWLGAPDRIESRYTSQDRLAEEFLALYNERKQTSISIDCFLRETLILWKIWLYKEIRWYLHELGEEPEDIHENEDPQVYKATVMEKLQGALGILLDER